MQDIGTQHFVFTGQGVDYDFSAGCAKSEVVKRTTACLAAVIKNLRGFVVPGARERHLAEVGLLDQAFKTDDLLANTHLAVVEDHRLFVDLILACRKLNQPLLDGFGCVLRGLAIEVGAAGCCCR